MGNKKRKINVKILEELKDKQLKTVNEEDLITVHYLTTISKYIKTSIFGFECALWTGYITNNGLNFVNFYYNNKKSNLHRLLYKNYIGELYDCNYLKYTCCNAGRCININHIEIKYKKPAKSVTRNKSYNKKVKKENIFTVEFL